MPQRHDAGRWLMLRRRQETATASRPLFPSALDRLDLTGRAQRYTLGMPMQVRAPIIGLPRRLYICKMGTSAYGTAGSRKEGTRNCKLNSMANKWWLVAVSVASSIPPLRLKRMMRLYI